MADEVNREQWAPMLRKGSEQVHLMWAWMVQNRPGSARLISDLEDLYRQLVKTSSALGGAWQGEEDARRDREARQAWEAEQAAKRPPATADEIPF